MVYHSYFISNFLNLFLFFYWKIHFALYKITIHICLSPFSRGKIIFLNYFCRNSNHDTKIGNYTSNNGICSYCHMITDYRSWQNDRVVIYFAIFTNLHRNNFYILLLNRNVYICIWMMNISYSDICSYCCILSNLNRFGAS